MSDETEKEKRRFKRLPINEKVRVDIDGESIEGSSRNISAGGISINSKTNIPNDTFVQLHIGNVGDVEGRIVRNHDDGFAVEFDTASKEGIHMEDKLKQMFADLEPESERDQMEEKFKDMFEGGEDDK
jgi:hypothetical protein